MFALAKTLRLFAFGLLVALPRLVWADVPLTGAPTTFGPARLEVVTDGVGLGTQPATLSVTVPAGASVAAAYLYVTGRGAGDATITLNGMSTSLPLLATSGPLPFDATQSVETRRLAVTLATGSNTFVVDDYDENIPGGAFIVAVLNLTSAPVRTVQLLEGADYAFRSFSPPFGPDTAVGAFGFPATSVARTARVLLFTHDTRADRGDATWLLAAASASVPLPSRLVGGSGGAQRVQRNELGVPAGSGGLSVGLELDVDDRTFAVPAGADYLAFQVQSADEQAGAESLALSVATLVLPVSGDDGGGGTTTTTINGGGGSTTTTTLNGGGGTTTTTLTGGGSSTTTTLNGGGGTTTTTLNGGGGSTTTTLNGGGGTTTTTLTGGGGSTTTTLNGGGGSTTTTLNGGGGSTTTTLNGGGGTTTTTLTGGGGSTTTTLNGGGGSTTTTLTGGGSSTTTTLNGGGGTTTTTLTGGGGSTSTTTPTSSSSTTTTPGGAPGPPNCGDGVVNIDEECDDGNQVSGDGCTACATEDTSETWKLAIRVRPRGIERLVYFTLLRDVPAALLGTAPVHITLSSGEFQMLDAELPASAFKVRPQATLAQPDGRFARGVAQSGIWRLKLRLSPVTGIRGYDVRLFVKGEMLPEMFAKLFLTTVIRIGGVTYTATDPLHANHTGKYLRYIHPVLDD